MMKEKKNIKIYTSIAILASLSSVISIFDKIINKEHYPNIYNKGLVLK